MRVNMTIMIFAVVSALVFYAFGQWLNGDPLRSVPDRGAASSSASTR